MSQPKDLNTPYNAEQPSSRGNVSNVSREAAAQASKIQSAISGQADDVNSLNTVAELPDHGAPGSFRSHYIAGDVRGDGPRVIGDEYVGEESATTQSNAFNTANVLDEKTTNTEQAKRTLDFDPAKQTSASGMQAKLAAAGAAPAGTHQPFTTINPGSGVPGAEQARGISTASDAWVRRPVNRPVGSSSAAARGFWMGARPYVRGALRR